MAEDTPTEDDLVRIMDEWVDDLAPHGGERGRPRCRDSG